jgi:hypothetical protein
MAPDCCANSEHGSNKHRQKKTEASRAGNGFAALGRLLCCGKPMLVVWDFSDAKRLGLRIDHASERVQGIELKLGLVDLTAEVQLPIKLPDIKTFEHTVKRKFGH